MATPGSIRRVIRGTTAISFIISGLISATWASRIPEVQLLFQLSNVEWGTVLFSVYAGLICGLPVSSWLIGKFGSFKMSFLSGIVFPILLSLLPFASSVPVLVLLLFLFGVARNLMNLSINTKSVEIQRLFKKSIVSSFHGIWSLACLIAAAIGTVMISRNVAPSVHFICIAVASMAAIYFLRDRTKYRERKVVQKGLFAKPNKFLLLLGALSFCAMMCEGAVYDWAVNHFDKSIIGGRQFVTAGYIAYLISMTSGRLGGDFLISRFGRLKIILMNGVLMASGFLLCMTTHSLVPAIFAFVLVGFGNSILMPIIYFLAGKSKDVSTSSAIATVTLIGYTGLLLQPVIMGFVTDTVSMNVAFGLMSSLGFVICGIALYLRKKVQFD